MKITNKVMYQLYAERNEAEKTFLGLLLKSRIKQFDKENFERFKTLRDSLDKLQREFFVIDKDNNIKTVNDADNMPKSVLLEGKTVEDYRARIEEVMNKETTIII